MDLWLRLAGGEPCFLMQFRFSLPTGLLARGGLVFLDFLFEQEIDFRVPAAERVDEFLWNALDLVDHGFGVGVLFEGP